jgi:hypothetical protein
MSEEYVLHIDGLDPDTVPMQRLAAYIKELADLFGNKAEVHFRRVEKGSLRLAIAVDDTGRQKVSERVAVAATINAPKDVISAFRRLDDLLAEDGSSAQLKAPGGATVIPFPGVKRERPLNYGPYRKQGTVEGQIVKIGGADKTSHLQLQHGGYTFTGIELTRELAREMSNLLYGPTIRLHGEGCWTRSAEGRWKLDNFTVNRFEILDSTPIDAMVRGIRELPDNGLMDKDAYSKILGLREGDEYH